MRLSCVLPAYNEETNIEYAVREVQAVASDVADEYEIVVVDDGSTDRTAEIVEKLSIEDPAVRLISHESNQGYGFAVKTGLQSAKLDYVFFTDADNQFDVSEVRRLIPYLERADVVCGYRIDRQDPWGRRFAAWAWNALIRALFYAPVRDIDCAFKLFKREALQGLDIDSIGPMFSTELMVKLGRSGYGIAEVGVSHYPRVGGSPTGASFKAIWTAFRELFRMRRALKRIDMSERAYRSRRPIHVSR